MISSTGNILLRKSDENYNQGFKLEQFIKLLVTYSIINWILNN